MSEAQSSASNSAVKYVECLLDSDNSEDSDDSDVKEVPLDVEDSISDRTLPHLNNDPEQAWENKRQRSLNNTNTFKSTLFHKDFQGQILEDIKPCSLLALSPEVEDTEPPLITLNFYEEDCEPAPSLEPPLLLGFLSDKDVKPSPLELMSSVQQAKPSSPVSISDEEDVKPPPITLNGQQHTTGCAESPVNFWTVLEGEDTDSPSDDVPDSPADIIAVSDGEWEPERKSRRKSTSDDDCDLQHPGRNWRANNLKRIPKGAQRSIAKLSKKKSPWHSTPSETMRWCTHDEMDIEPSPLPFMPARRPGPQHSTRFAESPLDFFRLFFTDSVIKTLLENTNAYGSQNIPHRDKWESFSFEDMFSFLSIVIFMGLLKLPQLVDYWKTTRPYNLPFPPSVMSKTKFLNMCRSLHLCSLGEDAMNQAAKGTSAYDRLGKIKPLYSQIVEAFRMHFHPDQNLSIDERKIIPNGGLPVKAHIRNKYTMGYKLLVLADSATGYAWNFFMSDGDKTPLQNCSGKGVAYDTVMSLMDLEQLGTGYHLYVDNFYTSPHLFMDLLAKNIGACGTFTLNKMAFLKTAGNDFTPRCPRGSIRWIRDGELLFVKWKDPQEVALCSTIHKAYEGETVHKRLKKGDKFVHVYLPVPPAVAAYNQYMRVDDPSDGIICYYNVLLKTKKWYRTFFYHFVDVAVVNAHILYNQCHKDKRMTQREFRDALVQELADNGSGATSTRAPYPLFAARTHKAVFLSKGLDVTKQSAATLCPLPKKDTSGLRDMRRGSMFFAAAELLRHVARQIWPLSFTSPM